MSACGDHSRGGDGPDFDDDDDVFEAEDFDMAPAGCTVGDVINQCDCVDVPACPGDCGVHCSCNVDDPDPYGDTHIASRALATVVDATENLRRNNVELRQRVEDLTTRINNLEMSFVAVMEQWAKITAKATTPYVEHVELRVRTVQL